MILKYSDDKRNTKTFIFLQCDNCGNEQRRRLIKYHELKLNSAWNMDYCEPCWVSVRQKSPEAKLKMSSAINKMIENDPNWSLRNSESKKGKINLGDSNGMKCEEARKKLSDTRKEFLNTPEWKKKISDQTKKAWADGKYEGVRVGQSKWHSYLHSNGTEYRVQGTWELAFIQWLDENNLSFTCHKGRIEYDINGEVHSYYPDFFVNEWDCYVDIKNDYHYSLQLDKFKSLESRGHKIKIILQKELETLINKKL